MSRMNQQLLNEAIAGLPTSLNPYAPAQRQDTDMSADTKAPAKTEDLPNPGPAASKEMPMSPSESENMAVPTNNSISDPNQSQSVPGGGGKPPTMLPQKQAKPTWTPFKTPNKKDVSLKRTDGFFLRYRAIDSVPGKYMAQMWTSDGKNREILDKGFVMVPLGDNPRIFITTLADQMLDQDSNRFEQEENPLDANVTDGKGEDIAEPGEAAPAGGGSPAPLASALPAGEDLSTEEGEEGAEGENIEFDDNDIELDDEITNKDLPEPQGRPEDDFTPEDLPSL